MASWKVGTAGQKVGKASWKVGMAGRKVVETAERVWLRAAWMAGNRVAGRVV